ncbi:MAG: hypothetical protein U1F11_05825 [Steroidobacteraceae bacterium]
MPLHGWAFDGGGAAAGSLAGRNVSLLRARIDAYPCQERYGIVFAFLGDLPEAERPGILEIPEWNQPGWTFDAYDFELKVNYERSIENALDPAHAEFVHPAMGISGRDECPTSRCGNGLGRGRDAEFSPPPRGIWRMLRKPGSKVTGLAYGPRTSGPTSTSPRRSGRTSTSTTRPSTS